MPKIITAHTGTPHITSNDVGSLLKAVIGNNDYLLSEDSESFTATLLDNNTIQLSEAEIVMQGTHVRIQATDKAVIGQGQNGLKRIDLIVCRYTKNENNIENAEIAVVKGTASVNPSVPKVTQGDIRSGAPLHEMPLFRVDIEDFAVTSIVNLCQVVTSLYTNLQSVLNLQDCVDNNKARIDTVYNHKLLWSGGHYMNGDQKISIPKISSQPNGIILVFSKFTNGAEVNTDFTSFFVHKNTVLNHDGIGHCFTMCTLNFLSVCTKYLYISDTQISGHDYNTQSGKAASGILYDNSAFVLRYVIGF